LVVSFALVVAIAGCNGGSESASTSSAEATTASTSTTVVPAGADEPTRTATTTPTNGVLDDATVRMAWAWPPPFVRSGETLTVEVVVEDEEQPDEIVLSIAGDVPVPFTFDVGSSRWAATVTVPTDAREAGADIVAKASTGGAAVGVLELAVPVVDGPVAIDPTVTEVEPTNAIVFDYGSDLTQLGFEMPEDFEIQTPQSLQVEPVTGNIVILDAVNRRLLVITPDGQPVDEIALAGDGRHEELVILGTTQQAVVSEWRAGGGALEVSVHLVDLTTGSDTIDGPVVVPPPTPPTNVPLVWNAALDAVYANVFDPATNTTNYYRLYDTARERIDISSTPESWWEPSVSNTEDAVGIRYGVTTITTELPFAFAGIVDLIVEPDGTVWWLAGTVDADDLTSNGVHYFLGRTDLDCEQSIITEIDLDSLSELPTRTLTRADTGVYVTNISTDAYQLLQYELLPVCN